MEPVNSIPMTQQDESTSTTLTLEQARDRMIELLSEAEANAWEIGDLLNQVEIHGLARRKGYGKTRSWLEAEVPGAAGKTTTLYRYAAVAAVYTKQQVKLWGISKLELLLAHDRVVLGRSNPEDPANREIQLVQPDGSTVVKRFDSCSWRELQQSTRERRKGQKAPDEKSPGTRDGKVRLLRKSSSNTGEHSGLGIEGHSLRLAFAMIVVGLVTCVVSQVLPLGLFGVWLALAGAGCFFGGVGIMIRHWHDFRERLALAVEEGRALQFLRERLDQATRVARRVATAIRSRLKVTNARTSSPEDTPPSEKKAA